MALRLWRHAVQQACTPPSLVTSLVCSSCRRCHAHEETTLAEYAERRQRLTSLLPRHSILLLPAADELAATHDVLAPHQQDAMFRHLFGLSTPLRRQLQPPSSRSTTDVRATMVIVARHSDAAAGAEWILCVPPVTTDPATVVWAAETVPFEAYENRLRVPSPSSFGVDPLTSTVVPNAVSVVCDTICGLVQRMVTDRLAELASEALAHQEASLPLTAKEKVVRDRKLLLGIAPHIFALYPRQLRWDGLRYQLLLPSSPAHDQSPAHKGAQSFHHPLEALFATLDSTAFDVPLPRTLFAGTAQQQQSVDAIQYRYKTAATYTPGLVKESRDNEAAARIVAVDAAAAGRKDVTTPNQPRTAATLRLPIRSADPLLWSYRLCKCPSQVRQHLRSARATADAFDAVMRSAAATTSEHELHCAFQRSVCASSARCGAAACVRAAYIPVIASGGRGTYIHYTDNSCAVLPAGEAAVVRVDAGVEVDGVPTDCTRTFPIGTTTFSADHAELYDGLVQLQRLLLRRIAPGVAVGEVARLHLDATRALLCRLGVRVSPTTPSSSSLSRTGDDGGADEESAPERLLPMTVVRSCLCAHAFGHLFGIDIHEEWGEQQQQQQQQCSVANKTGAGTSAAPAPRVFCGGMMHTVEPGIYLPSRDRARLLGLDALQLPSGLCAGVGMQVEDDVLILPEARSDGAGQATEVCGCPWSKGRYLQHAIAAFARYYTNDGCGHDSPASSWLGQLQALVEAAVLTSAPTTAVQPGAAAAVLFLFTQRVAIDGYAAAKAALAADVSRVTALRFTDSPVCGSQEEGVRVPSEEDTGWYPYSIVVLTATVPKDRCFMEMTMTH